MEFSNNTTNAEVCTEFGHPNYCIAISIVNRSGGVVSFISSIIVLVLILILRRYKNVAQRLFLYLIVILALVSLCFALSGISLNGIFCMIDGSIFHFILWAAVVSICNITVNLCWNVLFLRFSNKFLEIYFITMTFIVPTIFTIIPWLTLSFGAAGQWCWISNEGPGRLLRFLVFYIPLYIILIGTIIVYSILLIRLFLYVRKQKLIQSNHKVLLDQKLKKEIFVLIWSPLAFILVWILPALHRLVNVITQNDSIFYLAILHVATAPLMGLFISIFFFFDYSVLIELKWSNFKISLITLFKRQKSKAVIYAVNTTGLSCSLLLEKPVFATNKTNIESTIV